jgi:schlafen family protein
MVLDKTIEEISEADLTSLIDAGTPELKTLDYKQSLPGNSDEERKEFLADASSFANAAGGHLIYGMRAEAGVPVELLGMDDDGDAAILRLETSIRDGIVPRITGVHSTAIKLANSKTAVLVRVPKSFSSPHMVRFKNTSRFYSRGSNGKYQLDVDEIRAAFLGSAATTEGIRNFRLDRLSQIRARETAISLIPGPCAALHIIPLSAFGGNTRYDVIALKTTNIIYRDLAPLFHDRADQSRINFDGRVVYVGTGKEKSPGFLQLYRSGIVETVEASFISFPESNGMGKVISSLRFEVWLFRFIQRVLPVLKTLGVDPPLIVMLALIDVRGYTMGSRDQLGFHIGGAAFDRDVLVPQEVLIENYSADVPLVMKPLVDEIWNAASFVSSDYYRDGKWVGEDLARGSAI